MNGPRRGGLGSRQGDLSPKSRFQRSRRSGNFLDFGCSLSRRGDLVRLWEYWRELDDASNELLVGDSSSQYMLSVEDGGIRGGDPEPRPSR